MLHACFTPISLYFDYTSLHFYAFSGTNLLTRCHSASSCFLLFLYFRKVVPEIFSESDEINCNIPILSEDSGSQKGSCRRAWRGPDKGQARAQAWPRLGMVWAPRPPLTPPLRPYILCLGKTLDQSASIHEKFRRGRHRQP